MSREANSSVDGRLRIGREFVRGREIPVGVGLFLSLLATAASLAVPLAVQQLIATIQAGEASVGAVVLMTTLALTSAVCTGLALYLMARVGEGVVFRLRIRTARHVLRLPPDSVRQHGIGNLVARMTSDTAQLRSVVDIGVTQVPGAAFMVLGGLTIMYLIDWVLFLVTAGAFTVVGLVVSFLVVGIRRGTAAQQEAISHLAQKFTGTLSHLPIIKAYRANEHVTEEVSHSAQGATNGALKAARLQALVNPLVEFGLQIALIGVIVGSGARLASGALTIPEFAAFLLYLMQMIAPVTTVASGIGRLQIGLAARDRLERVLLSPQETDDAVSVPTISDSAPAIEFEGIDFAHDQQPTLTGTTFSAPRRGMTALVGPSGAGKTTILGMVERFHNASRGRVRVLGHTISTWPLEELRRKIAYVDQNFTLVEGTLRQNLLLGRDDGLEDARLYSVLDELGLREVVQELPDGLDTVIGRATDLSGGQRQRLAIARGVLSEAEIILLDEPTSQLDSVNEGRVRTLVDRLARDRAVLIVAHRISTIQHADHIVIVTEGGDVADAGTHDELMDRSVSYRNLVQGQSLMESNQPV